MNNLHNMAKVYSESVYLPYISYIYIYLCTTDHDWEIYWGWFSFQTHVMTEKQTWYKTFKISLHSWEPAELFCSEIVLKRTKSQQQTWNGKKRSCLLYEINRPV